LFPYPTLFRSGAARTGGVAARGQRAAPGAGDLGDDPDAARGGGVARHARSSWEGATCAGVRAAPATPSSARRKIASASSTSASLATSGGIQRTTLSEGPHVSSSSRSWRQAACTALAVALPP